MPPVVKRSDVTNSDWAALMDAVVALDEKQVAQGRQIDILNQASYTLTQQIAEVAVTLRRQDQIIADNSTRMDKLASAMQENTELTKDIRDLMTTGRTVRKLAVWAGGAMLVVAQFWDQIKTALKILKG